MDIEEIKEKKENLIKLYLTDSNKPKKYWVNLSVYNNQIIEELTKENENNEKTLTTWMRMEQKLQNENTKLKESKENDMQYYYEYCNKNGYVTPNKWLKELKHY